VKIAIPALVLGLIAACASYHPERKAENFDRAERLLAGKVAGKPVSCVSLRGLEGNRSLESDRILFETRGALLYVNRLRDSCLTLNLGRALRTNSRSGLLCQDDVVSVFDPQTGATHGECALGAFIPYRRAP
jgi:hypothetical protein